MLSVPSRQWPQRIQDILRAIASIQQQTASINFDEFTQNDMLVKAVLYDFIVIGEAATNVPTDVRSLYPQVPWRLMRDMRNVAAHEYFQINLRVVWNTAQNNLPPLIAVLEDILRQEAENGG